MCDTPSGLKYRNDGLLVLAQRRKTEAVVGKNLRSTSRTWAGLMRDVLGKMLFGDERMRPIMMMSNYVTRDNRLQLLKRVGIMF